MVFPGMPKGGVPKKPGGGGGGNNNNQYGAGFHMPGQGGIRAPLPKGGGGTPKPAPAAAGPIAGPAPAGPPDIESYLAGDQMYQSGSSELMKALAQFNAQNDYQQSSVRQAFETARGRMGEERTRALTNLKDDFGARGLINSGLFGKANKDYDTEFENRMSDLNTDMTQNLTNLGFERSNYAGLNSSENTRLRHEAMQRRAAQFNLF